MYYPHIELKKVNDEIGYGVFATQFIPKGTITYVQDELEPVISEEHFQKLNSVLTPIVNKYTYRDNHGNRILSWDFGNYVNHKCECNTMNTGYGFEIAIKDILPGEEITDEYGLLNLENEFAVSCGCVECRKIVSPNDINMYYKKWDNILNATFKIMFNVSQPLIELMPETMISHLKRCIEGQENFKSVLCLKYSEMDTTVPV